MQFKDRVAAAVTDYEYLQVYTEGTHLIIPFLERPIIYDVRARPNTITSTSGSRDLQMVNVSLRVLTRPDSRRLQDIYRTLGTDFDNRVLPSIIQETLKGVIAQYNASQLLTQREMVSKDIKRVLTERGAVFNIILEDVSITNLTFSREYTAAVEAKQVRAHPALLLPPVRHVPESLFKHPACCKEAVLRSLKHQCLLLPVRVT